MPSSQIRLAVLLGSTDYLAVIVAAAAFIWILMLHKRPKPQTIEVPHYRIIFTLSDRLKTLAWRIIGAIGAVIFTQWMVSEGIVRQILTALAAYTLLR